VWPKNLKYAEVDLEMKANAIETCAPPQDHHTDGLSPIWKQSQDLLDFLNSL
jgi:hypothetical protein